MRTGERGWQAGDAGWATELEIALTMELERAQPVILRVDEDIIIAGIRTRMTAAAMAASFDEFHSVMEASQDCASPACYQCHDAGVFGG